MKVLIVPAAALLLANTGFAPVEVTVTGIRSDAGQVVVDICPPEDFLKACPIEAKVRAHKGTVTVLVPGVPPGRYAIQAYHDANDNGDLNRGMFGIPKEGIGFSNDAMPRLLRPKFDVAAFDHARVAQRQAVTLRYFLG